MSAGTLNITANLTIGATTTKGLNNDWSGGTISGNGTLTIHGDELDVDSAASSVAANIVVDSAGSNSPSGVDIGGGTHNGILKLGGMNANLALAGASNGITIGLGGQVILDNINSAAQADQQGGITGGSNNVITIVGGGSLSRGTGSDNPWGQVLISVPVISKGGNFTLFDYDTGTNPASVVHLMGTDSAGYSYDDPVTDTIGGILEIGQRATLRADHGININTANGIFRMDVGSLGTPTELGNVNIDHGTLELFDWVAGTTSSAYIGGSLTLTQNSNVWENWNGNEADLLQVAGTVNLGNSNLVMYGATPPTKGELINVIAALDTYSINGDFGTFNWSNHQGTTFIHNKQQVGGTTYYQVGQTSQ